jgi:hypothetical protein
MNVRARSRMRSAIAAAAVASGWLAWLALGACAAAPEELGVERGALAVVKSFQDGVSPAASYAGTRDTYLSEEAPANSFGGAASCIADGDSVSGKDQYVLLKWNFGGADIPADATVTAVSITLNITNKTGGSGYAIHELKRDWLEAEATWSACAAGTSWELAGAQGASDRGAVSLGTLLPTATGVYTVSLNSASVALVQSWVNNPLTNRGVIIASSTNADGMDFSSREGATPSLRPKLTVSYTTGAAAATTYYADPAGSDANNGTSTATPWKTLKRASDAVLAPGDSLLLRRGATWMEALVIAESGTASAPIRVGAYGTGASPIIHGGNAINTTVRLTGSHLRVEDLTVTDATWAGIRVDGDFNVIERNAISRHVVGIQIQPGADGNKALRNTLTDNNKMSVATPCSVNCNDDSGAFGVVLQGNQNEIAYNTISGSIAPSPDYEYDGAAVEIYGGQYNSIHHNLTYDNETFTELGGGSIKATDNTFAYNLVRAASTPALHKAKFLVTRGAGDGFGPVYRTRAYNNTVYLAGPDTEGFVCYAGCGTEILTLRNNVVWAVKKTGYADAAFDEGYGLYWGGPNQFTMGAGSVRANPLFVSAATGDLHLLATSPGLESGTSANGGFTADLDGLALPFDADASGTAGYDKGCYERH